MDFGESVGGSAPPEERYRVIGRVVRFRILALSQRSGHHLTTFTVALDVTSVAPAGDPHRPIDGWRELFGIACGDRLELPGEPELAAPGLRPGDGVCLSVVRDGSGFRAVEMAMSAEPSVFLQGRVCEVRPVRSSSVPMIAIRLDVHDVFGTSGRHPFDAGRVPPEFSLRPWFVGPLHALLCEVRVGQSVVIRTTLVDGNWHLDRLCERRQTRPAARRQSSAA